MLTSHLASATVTVSVPEKAQPTWKIELLYDGQCPLCLREVRFLQHHDRGRGLIHFVDVMDPTYDPLDHGGVTFEAAMGRIHGVKADGTIIEGVEVFRQIYAVLGLGWIYAATRWPGIKAIVDALYDRWAAWRLVITGRPSLQTLVEQREQQRLENCGDRCKV